MSYRESEAGNFPTYYSEWISPGRKKSPFSRVSSRKLHSRWLSSHTTAALSCCICQPFHTVLFVNIKKGIEKRGLLFMQSLLNRLFQGVLSLYVHTLCLPSLMYSCSCCCSTEQVHLKFRQHFCHAYTQPFR